MLSSLLSLAASLARAASCSLGLKSILDNFLPASGARIRDLGVFRMSGSSCSEVCNVVNIRHCGCRLHSITHQGDVVEVLHERLGNGPPHPLQPLLDGGPRPLPRVPALGLPPRRGRAPRLLGQRVVGCGRGGGGGGVSSLCGDVDAVVGDPLVAAIRVVQLGTGCRSTLLLRNIIFLFYIMQAKIFTLFESVTLMFEKGETSATGLFRVSTCWARAE